MARIVSLSAYILSTVSPSCKHQVKKYSSLHTQ